MGSVTPNVHDLVQIDAAVFAAEHDDAPAWVKPSLQWAPWAVVRREHGGKRVPIGVRGQQRAQRYATSISVNDVLARIEPHDACPAAARAEGRLGDASRSITEFASFNHIIWGPVGSFGFELASGRKATTSQSDLDIVVGVATVARETLLALQQLCASIAARHGVTVDVELAFDVGGVALAEYATQPLRVLAKTARGPKLLPCP
ncbi:MAG: malonate decarboxylase holo-ACP synthase [Candidatus Eremiobacteraeota bacterium]|nr:malonate decarboxylase holo-ACP synthase [Candidatus Eremiobacteraeota bacterium]